MKNLIISLILTLAVAVGVNSADRNLSISTGYTMLNQFTLDTSDTIDISDTVTFTITNLQKYAQNQVFTIGLTTVSGSPSVAITAYGKVTSSSVWVQIGSPITWTTTANDGDITSTSPINYNYLKVEFISSGATQKSKVSTFIVKTSNAYDIPANSGTLTISRATTGAVTVTSKDDDANAATTYRAGGTGALTIGASTGSTAITSSDWAIGATGIATGLGAITSDGLITGTAGATITGAAVNLNATSNFAVNIGTGSTNAAVSIGGGSNTVAINSTALDISTTGAVTGATTITASGAVISASYNFATAAQVTGTGDSIVITNASIPAIAAGLSLTYVSEAANTTTTRLDLNGTVKDVYEEAGAAPNALEANDIRSGAIVTVVYDGTRWVQISPSGN